MPSGAGTGAGGGDRDVRLGGAAKRSAFLAANEGLGVFGGAFFFFLYYSSNGTLNRTGHEGVDAVQLFLGEFTTASIFEHDHTSVTFDGNA